MDDRERRSRTEGFRDGVRQGLGILSAFKEAIEETIREAREGGDLSSERAREIMKDAMDRAQSAADEARERLDFVTHRELDEVRRELEELRNRLSRLEEEAPGSEATAPGGAGADTTERGPGHP